MFPTHVVLQDNDICNQKDLRQKLIATISGHASPHVVLYGRRNMGKTSLLKSVAIPSFEALPGKKLSLYVDFFGVSTLEQITQRLDTTFQTELRKSSRSKRMARAFLEIFQGLEPRLVFDTEGEVSFSVGKKVPPKDVRNLEALFERLQEIAKSDVRLLLIFDEFQDVALVPGAESILRGLLQNLDHSVPVILSGSKKHLLAQMFSEHSAAFYNWGEPLSVGPIAYAEYFEYMKERFKSKELNIDLKTSTHLQNLAQRNCEAINMLCSQLWFSYEKRTIDKPVVDQCFVELLRARQGPYEEYLSQFSLAELEVLIAMAKTAVLQPTSQDFLKRVAVSKAGVDKIVRRLLDRAMIYFEAESGYELADPLLAAYLRAYR